MAQAESYANVISAEVLPGWVQADGSVMAGLKLSLEPGWKTYWRAPGDAGIPPTFSFGKSDNLAAVRVHWPRPDVQMTNGMRTIGYSDQVVLPIEFTPHTKGQPLALRGSVDLGVCLDICIPVTLDFGATLPGTGGDTLIRAALTERPDAAKTAGVGKVTCQALPIADGLRLTTTIALPPLGGAEFAVIELPDRSIWISEAEVTREDGKLVAVVDMVPETAAPFALNRSDVRITLLTDHRAVDIRGCTGS